MSAAPVIRRAAPADLGALEPLMATFNAAEQIAWNPRAARPAIARLLASDEVGVVLAAESAGELCGYAVITWSFDLEFTGRDAFLTEIFVAPAHRRRRLGRRLVQAALAATRDGGAAALHLQVDPANLPAIALYRGAAFVRSHRVSMTHVLPRAID